MKKLVLFVAMIGVLAISMMANVGVARAGGITLEFTIQGITQQDLNNAYLYSFSEYHQIECVIKDKEAGRVACNVPPRFAGGEARVYVAGQTFYVTAPVASEPGGNGSGTNEISWPANGRPFGHWPNSAFDYCGASSDPGIDLQLYQDPLGPNYYWIAGAPGQTLPGYNTHSMLPNYPTDCVTFYGQGHQDTRP